ncbi:MAG TPA: T9SS type B sorting domain-containing protein [Cyclobacteriaceae bacterium]|nr:T9SS type B sorting domain-containing protein [Cyclobacteriaceae bacterium]
MNRRHSYIRLLLVAAAMFCFYTTSFSQCGCTFLISTNNNDITFDGTAKNAKPGDKICFPNGTRTGMLFKNLKGTPEKPIIITNRCDGKATVQAPTSWGNVIEFQNSQYVIVTGSSNPSEFYGMDISGANFGVQIHDLSSDFEVDHLYIHDVLCTPLQAKTNPTCDTKTWRGNFTLRNINIHDLSLANTGCEAFYIGNSHYDIGVTLTCNNVSTKVWEHDVDGVKVINCKLLNIGNDGIQVGAATNAIIHDNIVINTGLNNNEAHMNGIQVGSGTTNAIVYNNIVDGAHGYGLADFGGGTIYYNNIVTNSLLPGIFLRDDAPAFAPRGFTVVNNVVINSGYQSVYMLSENPVTSKLENNIIVTPVGLTHVYKNNSNVKLTDANNIKTFDITTVKFKDPNNKDYHLLAGAAAIDAGSDQTGVGVVFDLENKPRPKGTKMDIGAYEVQPPGLQALAGVDQSITLPTTTVSITGGSTGATGTAKYEWSKKSGPSAGTIVNPLVAGLVVNGLVEGAYVFELKVTDDVTFAFDQVNVNVLPAAVNQNPTANAGADQAITVPAAAVQLTGLASDPDGTVKSVAWTKFSGPAANIVSPSTPVTVVNGLVEGIYQFQFTVTDNKDATATDFVRIDVKAAGTNQLPIVSAGNPVSVFLPTTTATLTGTASDPDGSISTRLWEKKSGGSASMTGQNSLELNLSNLAQGSYTFRLTVTDNKGGSSFSEVVVQVLQGNQPPTANAGNDTPLVLPTNSIEIQGSGTDTDGNVVSYEWVKVSGPSATLAGVNTSKLTVTNMQLGTYVFGLKIIDTGGADGYDEVTIAVTNAPTGPNELPLAFAGGNVPLSLPTTQINLYGSGFDADGSISTYSWSKASGGAATLVNANTPTLTVTGLNYGQYVFRLTVTDDKGATDDDLAIVSVSEAGTNLFPRADAGADKIIRLPQTTILLDGSGSDEDGEIKSFAWTQVSGGTASIATPAAATTTISGLAEGEYVFRLTVTDDDGASDLNEVLVRVVSSTNNLPPIVNAGPDKQIFLPISAIVLSDATASDDGSISTYQWTKLAGPNVTLENPTQLALSLKNLVQGDYSFQLTVTDNSAAAVFDIVRVSVLPASFAPPVVDAGSDQDIFLPTTDVILTGTATSQNSTITSTIWTKKIGGDAVLADFNTLTLKVTGLKVGKYVFSLTATADDGKSTSDDVQVTVNPTPPNQAPIVTAGASQVVKLPATQATLAGTAIDSDGTVASVAWSQVSGPNTATFTDGATLSAKANGLVVGNYIFKLSATDNLGATGSTTTIVAVIDPAVSEGVPPVALAPNDTTIVIPVDAVQLKGRGVDVDGVIQAFNWEQVSGGPINFFVNDAFLDIPNPPAGIFEFKLTVFDDDTLSASDNVVVTFFEKGKEIPTFFSPNADGLGENWVFKNIDDYQTCKLSVFSRSGKVVYEAAPYQNNWNGTLNGTPLSDGDYYYNLNCDDGRKINGAVRIIR